MNIFNRKDKYLLFVGPIDPPDNSSNGWRSFKGTFPTIQAAIKFADDVMEAKVNGNEPWDRGEYYWHQVVSAETLEIVFDSEQKRMEDLLKRVTPSGSALERALRKLGRI
jgi:hypothetical protein